MRARRAAALALGLAVAATACRDGTGPTAVATTTGSPGTRGATGAVVVPAGYTDTVVDLTLADGTVLAWCVWLADDAPERSRGLMEVTDLDGRAGMLFRYDAPSSGAYYMLRTRLPLSIAYFHEGAFVSATDMAPCPDDDDDPACPRYAAAGPYTAALEVPLGALDAAGVGPGTVLAVAGDCG